jgi:hypothetical protein
MAIGIGAPFGGGSVDTEAGGAVDAAPPAVLEPELPHAPSAIVATAVTAATVHRCRVVVRPRIESPLAI